MYRSKMQRYGPGSSQGVDGASGRLGGLTLRVPSLGRRMTPVTLASQTEFPHIADSMKEMEAKHTDKRRFQLPLKTAFDDTVKIAGYPEPEVNVEQRGGYFIATIDIMIHSKNSTIQGDLCSSEELALTSAIDQALVKLKVLENVILVDISARKTKYAIRSGRESYLKGCSCLLHVGLMKRQWLNCLDNIESVVQFTEENLNSANVVQRQFADAVHTSLLILKAHSTRDIGQLDGRFTDLHAEKEKYVAYSRSEPIFIPQLPKKKAYYHEVDALAHFLQWLNLSECRYSTELDENSLYLGAAELTLPDNRTIMLWAKHHKSTTAKAQDAAAREAIFYLEDLFKVDVAGYNHKACVLAEQETFVWKGLYEEIFKLADDVIFSWQEMLTKLQGISDRYKTERVQFTKRPSVGSEMAFIDTLLERVDLASAKCTQKFNVAATKLASLK